MGKRGPLGAVAGAAQQFLGGGPVGVGGGRGGSRLVRVYADGSMVQIQQKRRRKGFRMPRAMAEMIRAQTDMTRQMGTAMVLGAIK